MKAPKQQTISYGAETIAYDIIFSQRKTLSIRVHPDGHVSVRAPLRATQTTIREIVLQKADWILRHQQRLKTAPRPAAQPHYISGEMHPYLGQQYPLYIVQGAKEGVALVEGQFNITVRQREDASRIAALLDRWYRREAGRIFAERLALCWPRVAFLGVKTPPSLSLRLMKSRWGSCSTKAHVTLNLRLIHKALDLIDYVILHELCHLKEMNHSRAFYALMDQALPNWRECRKRLNGR